MRTLAVLTLSTAALALAACDSGEETADMPMAAEDMEMASDMAMSDAERLASAEGTITAIDAEAGTVTIDHEPVASVGWPAMTMAFEADAALREGLAVGDEVAFDFSTSGEGNRLTAIRPR